MGNVGGSRQSEGPELIALAAEDGQFSSEAREMICGIEFIGPLTSAEARAMGYGSWVYVIYCGNGGGPKYVGQSSNLATRFTYHPKHSPGDTVYVAAVDAKSRLIEERRLIAELAPPLNRVAGRPKKPAERSQTAALTIRMTTAEREKIDRAGGYEPGVWARGVLLKAADRILGKTQGGDDAVT